VRSYRTIGRPVSISDAQKSANTLAPRSTSSEDKVARQLRVRKSSLFRTDDAQPVPSLVRMIQGSGRSPVPFKLYLLLLWMAGSAGGVDPERTRWVRMPDPERLTGPHTTVLDLQLAAEVLLLDDFSPQSSNKVRRRLESALGVLANDIGLLEVGADGASIRLLAEDGSGGAYTDPFSEDQTEREPYTRLPSDFFLNGWFSVMTPPEIFALLLHTHDSGRFDGDGKPLGTFFNEERLRKFAPISGRTMDRGEKGLVDLGVATRVIRRYARASYGSHYEYFVNLDRLKKVCPDRRLGT